MYNVYIMVCLCVYMAHVLYIWDMLVCVCVCVCVCVWCMCMACAQYQLPYSHGPLLLCDPLNLFTLS